MTGDLVTEALGSELGGRPFRTYPALLSTEADAMAWARSGGPAGAVVVADYQASPRGRGGWPWQVRPGHGLGFSVVLRPDLPPEEEGWLYVAASVAFGDVLADVVGAVAFAWPDEVTTQDGSTVLVRLGMFAQLGQARISWAVVTALVEDAAPPRGPLLARLTDALDERLAAPPGTTLPDYRRRCTTLGRFLRARLVPLGPAGPAVVGEAVDVLADGALVLRTPRAHRVAVRPGHLGLLESAEPDAEQAGPPEPPSTSRAASDGV